MPTELLHHLAVEISSATGSTWHSDVDNLQPLSGGCINDSYLLRGDPSYFLKANTSSQNASQLFATEAHSLQFLASTGAIRIPSVICQGKCQTTSYLVLEYINMQQRLPQSETAKAFEKLGFQLAALHQALSPNQQYGWNGNNYIGATPQPNEWGEKWSKFWQEKRLGWQLKLAKDKGITFRGADRLLEQIPQFFIHYSPAPSLLHGDLWSGNIGFDEMGDPVLFDPASYYGDRETDLAFTELFGGFPTAFYDAYDTAWPRDHDWKTRRDLYNLYHVLNHHHLFGGHYAQMAQGMIHSLNRLC